MKKKQLYWQLPFLVLLIAGTVFVIRQQRSMPYVHNKGFVFGTVYNVQYQSETDLDAEIKATLDEVDALFSMFNDSSLVSRINRGEQPELSGDFLDVYRMAGNINKESGGAFDITVAPLVNAWGFGFKHEQLPSQQQVDSLLRFVGMSHFQIVSKDGYTTIKRNHPSAMLDFSAIAKGYGSDCVARLLSQHGISNYMVEIGGEVVTHGVNPHRLPWKIGVTKPVEDSLNVAAELQTVLNVTDRAMATSGNYRNFYYKGGRKYAHTIDPKSGHPVQHSLLSATVLAKDCATADAFATAFMVMGIEKARKVLDRHPELMAYFIYSDKNGDNAVWFSPSLEGKINE